MASQQARRENVTDERKIEVEKDKVPKMTTHFESLAEKTKAEQDVNLPRQGEKPHQYDTVPPTVRVVGVEYTTGSAHTGSTGPVQGREEKPDQAKSGPPSLEEISEMRGKAQQNTMESIRAAEERYNKAKDSIAQSKDSIAQSKDISPQSTQKESHEKRGSEMEKGHVTSTMGTAAQKAKEVIVPAAQKAKEVIAPTAQTAAEYAKGAKDTTVDKTMVAAQYVGEKAKAAKDVTVEGGKGVAEQAVVAGWGAAHYTMEAVAEATKTVAGVTSGVAGYTAGAGQKVAGFAGEKIAAAKDAVVATEEKAAEFAARKQEAARRDLEQKKAQGKSEGEETFPGKEEQQQKSQRGGGEMQKPREEYFHVEGGARSGEREEHHEHEEKGEQHGRGGEEYIEQMQQQQPGTGGGGVFQAIGETIVEIGQTTKDLLVGGQSPLVGEDGSSKEHKEVPYKGAGEGI